MAFDTNRDSIITRTGALEIDEGLRQYMLKVYNYMTSFNYRRRQFFSG